MIDIIIPAYNAHKTIRDTLLSVANQTIIDDIKVYIVNDASKKDYSKEVKMFKGLMHIEELSLPENSGPAVARQYGLDNTDSEYIIFLDSDDLFYDRNSVELLRNAIDDNDISRGALIEELGEDSRIIRNDEFSLHGKLYRRSIIDKYNIKFDPFRSREANAHEDNSFNNLYELCCKNINEIEDVVYIYKYNVESITKNEISEVKSMENYIRAMDWLTGEVEKRKLKNYHEIARRYSFILYYSYFTYLLDPDTYKFMYKMLSRIKKLYNKTIDSFEYNERVNMYKIFDYPIIPTITFYEFLDNIK